MSELTPSPETSDKTGLSLNARLSPDERMEDYRKFLRTEEAKALKLHRSGAGGVEVCQARSEVIDTLLSKILDVSLIDQEMETSPIALIAIGGYGRGTLNPGSDIDLLFLLPKASTKLPGNITELIQRVLYVIWDLGFKLGHSSRSVTECIQEAQADPQNLTALIDARFINGDAALLEQMKATFEKECLEKKQDRFMELRLVDQRSRYSKSSHTVFLQEPNVKESCGGLRDYQNILWLARVKKGAKNFQDLVDQRLITAATRREIIEAYDFILRVRNELHYHTGKATDILTLLLQGVVATAFKYPQRSILRRTEAFMRDYYRHTRHLYRHTTSFMETLEIQKEETSEHGLRSYLTFRKKSREVFDGFIAREGRIYPANQDIFTDDMSRLMRLFQHTQRRELKLSPQMRRLIANHWDDIDRPFRYLKANRETFQAILERKGEVARTLRQMHRIGFLGRYLPEFGVLDCLVQHEFFHRYTADEHTLRCIDELDKLVDNTDPRFDIFRRIFHEVKDPYALYLALILHDTGRSENVREHIDGSAMLAIKLCSRLQIKGRRRALIMFLVDNHLTFYRTATTRNLDDPEVIAEFASIMKTPELLDALILFTFCDSNGTSPDAWNGWKESLMLQLHKATRRFLTEGREKFQRRLHKDRLELRDDVLKIMDDSCEKDIEEHFNLMPSGSFSYREPTHVVSQIEAVRTFLDLEKENDEDAPLASAIKWITLPEKGYSELIVATRDRAEHLEKLCCALASEQINILSADLFSRDDAIVMNIFRVCTTNFEPVSSLATQKRVAATFKAILSQEHYNPEKYLKAKTNFLKPRTTTSDLPVPVRAHVSNVLHPTCTTVEIQALDRIGLLHDLFHTINEAGLDTTHARICTEKGVAMDTLYITTQDDKQIEDPELIEQLEKQFNELVSRPEA